LRSPLTRLNLSLELARKHLQAENDVHLGRIAKESERLNDLIGQLLTLTRIEALKTVENAVLVQLDALLREIAEDIDFETSSIDRGVNIVHAEPLAIVGSRELLRQAIENIVRNAAYYTPPGSRVEMSLFAAALDESSPSLAVIRVRDFGPGVPEEKLAHLVEPFFRVADARERHSGGTGIGLAIAHQAVRLHHGSLILANAKDPQGLVVEIHLPLSG
jgi:two-component system sensor histidine kinase CpxA